VAESVLTRRNLLNGAVVGAVGAVAGFVSARNRDVSAAGAANGYSPSASAGATLAALSQVPDGGGVVLDSAKVVLVREGGQVHAFSAVCTHQGCLVSSVADGRITCPCHNSVFDASTGAPIQGPATAPLPPVQVSVRAGNVVEG
jgi:nitrite reductase/ring-hydroxylating ferredoxin subunit